MATLKDFLFPKQQLYCKLCGRDRFIRKTAHKCVGGYRKHKIEWGFKNVL